ncbi:MAG: hypothetical protein JF589_01930 [Gemmatimonadetes bacterium]|nr:hypothetical protein [Gemmatimonadota bacterium]
MRGTLEQQVGDERIREARIAFRNGTEISLRDATVRSDSVIGFSADGRERRAILLADVASIEHREVSVVQTGTLVVVAAAVAYVAYIYAAFARLGPTWTAVPSPAPSVR